MSNEMDTVTILRDFNRWRRGDESTQPDPRMIGEAIDAACAEIERLRAETRDLRGRLSDAETVGAAAVRIRSLPTINSAQIDNEPQP